MILHVDCNSFYASCEQAFQPALRGKPVVVLSNNDGIVVALSKEAKAAGLARGDPYFEVRDLIERAGGAVFSSNYTLYADMSGRIYRILADLAPAVEPYSIDESFLFFPPLRQIGEIAWTIKTTVERDTGVPVSIGIAQTKTLAKAANKLAKKGDGVLDLAEIDVDAALAGMSAGDVWGIGGRFAERLAATGIRTALDLKRFPLHSAKKLLTLRGYCTVAELNGTQAIDRLEPKPKKNIIASRSFRDLEDRLPALEEATADYCLEAVLKMRKQRSAAKAVGVALMTDRFRTDLPQRSGWIERPLAPPSSYAPDLVREAIGGLRDIYRPGYRYRKVLVYLLGLIREDARQPDFFVPDESRERALMSCFDEVNEKYGAHTLFLGAQGIEKTWAMRREFLSPRYTTSWADIPKVR